MSVAQQPEALTVRHVNAVTARDEWSVEDMVLQAQKIQQCMQAVMKRDEHYGVIPGTQGRDGKPAKPTLLKPGAEKLCLMFRLDPEYEIVNTVREPTLISYMVRCVLFHIPTQSRIASGLGSCNSREDKYVRAAAKKCPKCSKETIIKGREEYGGGWLCFAKKGGCGGKFPDGDASIEQQDTGIKDPADLDNTLLKMACKRALIAAVLNGTAASDCFTQDLEDLTEKAAEYQPPREPPRDIGAHAGDGTEGKGSAPKAVAAAAERKTSSAPTASSQPAISTAPAASTAAPSQPHSAPAATRPTGKRVTAADIKHEGVAASRAQIAKLHILQPELTTLWRCTDEKPCCGAKVNVDKCCGYHEKLGRFRDQKGDRITTSKDLSADQMTYLLNWCEKTIATRKIDEDPRHIDGEPERLHLTARDPGDIDDGPAEKADLDALEVAAVARWGPGLEYRKAFAEWLKGCFDYDDVFSLTKGEARDAATMIREGR